MIVELLSIGLSQKDTPCTMRILCTSIPIRPPYPARCTLSVLFILHSGRLHLNQVGTSALEGRLGCIWMPCTCRQRFIISFERAY